MFGRVMSPLTEPGRRARAWFYVMGGGAAVAAGVTPVVATGTWLLLTDPGLATSVVRSGDLMPLAWAIADTLGEALRSLIRYL
ncbi:MAG: hypothetical protein ABI880_14380 [Acidobacteriota bacterium]